MKSLVLYSSQSGNTRKLADAVYEALPEVKEIYAIENTPDSLTEFDLIAVGFWFQGGRPDRKTADFLPKLRDRNVFLFYDPWRGKGIRPCTAGHGRGKIAGVRGKCCGDIQLPGRGKSQSP